VLPKIIYSTQSTFIERRGLLDSILVPNEVAEKCKEEEEGSDSKSRL